LTNKSTNKDLAYYVTECANVLGLKQKVDINDPKAVLVYIFNKIIQYKTNQVEINS
jgi:hypothetical protein